MEGVVCFDNLFFVCLWKKNQLPGAKEIGQGNVIKFDFLLANFNKFF